METKIYRVNPERPELDLIREAAGFIRQGGLVVFPTETVYGLGADYRSENALTRMYQLKERPRTKPFSLHLAAKSDLAALGIKPAAEAQKIIDRFWPGPLTLILTARDGGKVGVRIPANEVARLFIRECGTFLAASSANLSGSEPPVESEQMREVFNGKVEAIIDAGRTRYGRESTILDTTIVPYRVLREGVITREDLLKDAGAKQLAREREILLVCTGNSCRSPMAAGLLNKMLGEKRKLFRIGSAGIAALNGVGAAQEAIEVMAEIGIDISRHRSSAVTPGRVKSADLILVMEEVQKEIILISNPGAAEKLFLLDEYGRGQGEKGKEIPDPIGKPVAEYRRIRRLLAEALARVVEKL